MEIEKAIKAVRKEIAFYKHEKKELDEWEPMDAMDAYTSGYSEAAVKVDQQLNGLEIALDILRAQAEREKGCPLCRGRRLNDAAITSHWGESRISLVSGTVDENERFKFCPNCGRKLVKNGE